MNNEGIFSTCPEQNKCSLYGGLETSHENLKSSYVSRILKFLKIIKCGLPGCD
jgi:hypothetical protein